MRKDLTQARLKEALHYDPETGVFTRAVKTLKSPAGSIVGMGQKCAYLQVGLKVGVADHVYDLHVLAWLYIYGTFPEGVVDHEDGDTHNNRIKNLRLTCKSGNAQNMVSVRGTTSGLTGVSWDSATGKWRAQIVIARVVHRLGRFSLKEEAHQAYLTAKAQLHTFQPVPRKTTT